MIRIIPGSSAREHLERGRDFIASAAWQGPCDVEAAKAASNFCQGVEQELQRCFRIA